MLTSINCQSNSSNLYHFQLPTHKKIEGALVVMKRLRHQPREHLGVRVSGLFNRRDVKGSDMFLRLCQLLPCQELQSISLSTALRLLCPSLPQCVEQKPSTINPVFNSWSRHYLTLSLWTVVRTMWE